MIKKCDGSNIKVACILDEISYECFKYEGDFIQISPDNWQTIVKEEKVDLLFVESAINGIDNKWFHKIINTKGNVDYDLINIINFCKCNNIPTVFWNKEDPIWFNKFINTASIFDYVFTTDINCIDLYKRILGHEKIFNLNFAAQPKLHNPIDKDKGKLGQIAFAGTYYNNSERCKEMNNLLLPALNYEFHIYDRMKDKNAVYNYCFPHIYKPYIKGFVPYNLMGEYYKKYDIFLNVNFIKHSPSMFSRRIYELLACGTNVISSYSIGIEQMFNDIIKLSNSTEETEKYINLLINNKELRDSLSLKGQREVFKNHTYEDRLKYILKIVGIPFEKSSPIGVSILCYISNYDYLKNVLNNYNNQKCKTKELFLLVNKDSICLQDIKNEIKNFSNVTIIENDNTLNKKEAILSSIKHSCFEYVSFFDEKDYYAQNYISDLINAFQYTDADLICKETYYSYLLKEKKLKLINENKENTFTSKFFYNTCIIKKSLFNKISFEEILLNHQTNIKIYSADRFNYINILYDDDYFNNINLNEIISCYSSIFL